MRNTIDNICARCRAFTSHLPCDEPCGDWYTILGVDEDIAVNSNVGNANANNGLFNCNTNNAWSNTNGVRKC